MPFLITTFRNHYGEQHRSTFSSAGLDVVQGQYQQDVEYFQSVGWQPVEENQHTATLALGRSRVTVTVVTDSATASTR